MEPLKGCTLRPHLRAISENPRQSSKRVYCAISYRCELLPPDNEKTPQQGAEGSLEGSQCTRSGLKLGGSGGLFCDL